MLLKRNTSSGTKINFGNIIAPIMDQVNDLLSNPATFKLAVTALCVILVGFVIRSFFSVTEAKAKLGSAVGDDSSKGNIRGAFEDDDEDEEDDTEFSAQTMLDPSTDNAILYGKTDKYEWSQNELEVEMFIGLKASGDVKSKNVDITIKVKTLKVVVNGATLLEGEFFAKVEADESSWQLDTNDAGEKVIWITLYKATPTVRNQHWKCVLKGDQEISVNHLGPPVHGVDPNDPDAVKKAIQQVRYCYYFHQYCVHLF